MDATRLETFVQVARHGSLSAAARALGVSTSAVSQQVGTLERECGVSLVERRSRGVLLTDAGQALLPRAEEVIRALEDTRTTAAQLTGSLAGTVRVGSIASGAAALLLPAIHHLRRSAPEIEMKVSIMEPARSIEAVVRDELDAALIDVYDHVPVPLPTHLRVDELVSEPLVLVDAPGSDLPAHPTLKMLKDRSWVLPPSDAACGAATRYACRSVGFEPRVRWETDDLLLLVAAVSRGEGVALLPRRAVADTVAPVVLRRLVSPTLERRIISVSRFGTSERPTVAACLASLQHVARHAPAPVS